MVSSHTPIQKLLAMSKLPPFPAVATRLMEVMSKEDVSFPAATKLLMMDASFSAELLRAANSPLFGTRHEVKDIGHALATLGLDRVGMLVITTALWRSIPGVFSRQAIRSWWRHNLATAYFAKHLQEGYADTSDFAYMAGLLHSVGQLALLSAYPAEFLQVLEQAAATGTPVQDCERESFGVDDCELGAELLAAWHLPDTLVDAARNHHNFEVSGYPTTRWAGLACLASTYLGHAAFVRAPTNIDDLPQQVRKLVEDEALCVAVEEKVNALELSLL